MNQSERYVLNAHVAWRDLDGHIFAVTPDNRQHELSGAVEYAVWNALADNSLTLTELVHSVTQAFDVDMQTATTDLQAFLRECVAANLVCIS